MADVDLTGQLRAAGLQSQAQARSIIDEQTMQQRCNAAATMERVRGEGILLAMAESLHIPMAKDASKAAMRAAIDDLNGKLASLRANVDQIWGLEAPAEAEVEPD